MVARKRKLDEDFPEYRKNLKIEAVAERIRLAGRWVWRSFIPHPDYDKEVERLTKGLTHNQAKIIIDEIPWHKRFLKMVPFRKPKEEK
jgi:hypothetical protein